MLSDFKSLRRYSGKNHPNPEEIENVPVSPRDSLGSSSSISSTDSSRPPLNTIQEPVRKHNSKSATEQHNVGGVTARGSKVDRTTPKKPTKPGNSTAITLLRTPDKQALSARPRFGRSPKNDFSSSAVDSRDEARVDVMNHTNQSSRGFGNGNGNGNGGSAAHMATPRANRIAGRADSTCSEINSTQSTPTKSVTKPPNPGLWLTSSSRAQPSGGARNTNFAALSRGIPVSGASSIGVNAAGVPHFDLKEDPFFWMEHNVQVLIRVRPLNNMEKNTHGYSRCLKQESAQCITWIGQPETRFTFDHVACETVDQETLFRMVGLPMVENCLSGYNSCMFAYGQTGSGKTYTMLGEIEELEVKPSPNRGMTPRIFEFLFARIRAEEESHRDERLKYNCKCSFLEIYNEQIIDLLDPSSTNLLLREDIKKGVYVENLTEFEVHSVADILQLISQGSSNRKVAATNMNRESSRSHSVFTCVIESRWEKDSASNLRFARLNLVDLAGSERQKTSGAEGERLKEAANINKSLSTLGHVIMILVDVANGKPRHIPYRDSRLTFLLQDSLGGNSKTMIIANVSPSISCAVETLSTLKFAQRAKLIQNNAVVNEDSSGDVTALQFQIQLLKEELSVLKRQHVSRSLSFGGQLNGDRSLELKNSATRKAQEIEVPQADNLLECKPEGVRVSSKQLKTLESTLAGALRREQMAENSIKQLEAEIEQLNRLVRQREEDNRCAKMMLKFREDKIQRMESLLGGLMPTDAYLLEETKKLSEEIWLLQEKVDKNPEVTRFALENIRLLEQLRRFQDFYEEGEREMLLAEISDLRNQLVLFLSGNLKQNHPDLNLQPQDADVIHLRKENDSLHLELKRTLNDLEECRTKLSTCLENNARLSRELDLHASLNDLEPATHDHDGGIEVVKESIIEAPSFNNQTFEAIQKLTAEQEHESLKSHTQEIMGLQLELDILKTILEDQKSSHGELETIAESLNRELKTANGKVWSVTKQFEDLKNELKDAKLVIEALESQQILLINELEDLRSSKGYYAELSNKQELEISSLKQQISCHELRGLPALKQSKSEDTSLQIKMKKMQDSLEKAKQLNGWYQRDRACHASSEEEMDEVRKQVEAETAEVILCLQDELASLHQQVQDSTLKEMENRDRLVLLQFEVKDLQDKINLMTQDNEKLQQMVEQKDKDIRALSEGWETVSSEIEGVLAGGHEALQDASDQLDAISSSFPLRRAWVSEQLGRITKCISEKESIIEELSQCLEDANNRRHETECMLRSLKGAALVISEAQQQESCEKDKQILLLTSELSAKKSAIAGLESQIKYGEQLLKKTSTCATAAFLIVNRLSELNSISVGVMHEDAQFSQSSGVKMQKDAFFFNMASAVDEVEKEVKVELGGYEESWSALMHELPEEQKLVGSMEGMLNKNEENAILNPQEKLSELVAGVSLLKSCVNDYLEQLGSPDKENVTESVICVSAGDKCQGQTGTGPSQWMDVVDVNYGSEMNSNIGWQSIVRCKNMHEKLACGRTSKNVTDRDATIILLKKEIESALKSLKEVQAEMAKLLNEKEEILISGKWSQESIQYLKTGVLALQATMDNFEQQLAHKILSLDITLQRAKEGLQDAANLWYKKNEFFEIELIDAKVVATQKNAEASCIIAKFEEAQDTMKEADIMINGLMIANETMKLEIETLKQKEATFITERDSLMNELQCLQNDNIQKNCYYESLGKQFESDFIGTNRLVMEMEGIIAQVHSTFEEYFLSIASKCSCLKSQFNDLIKVLKSSLDEIWSEIIVRDCAVSVLHLCHTGILLETVTGLHAENGLLHHGLCESNSVISELREHNFKSKRELEICRVLEGKLLSDIKNSFDRISRKEDKTGELSAKLTTFEKKILDLHLQEEVMLQRSNHISSELMLIMKELDQRNNVLDSLFDQEKLLKDREEALISKEEHVMIELFAKDFGFYILGSELEQMASQKADVENEQMHSSTVIEHFKKSLVFLKIDAELKEQIWLEKEFEVALLNDTLTAQLNDTTEAKMGLEFDLQKLESDYEKLLLELKKKETAVEKLKNDICLIEASSSTLQNELEAKDAELREMCILVDENVSLHDKVRKLQEENFLVIQDLGKRKHDLESSLSSNNVMDAENRRLQNKIFKLENCITDMQTDLDAVNVELNGLRLCQSIVKDELCSKMVFHVDRGNSLNEENIHLRNELRRVERNEGKLLTTLSWSTTNSIELAESVDLINDRVLSVLTEENVSLQKMFQDMSESVEKAANFVEQVERLEDNVKTLIAENLSLETELSRKDEILEGLLFDLRLLQESASSNKDQKYEIEELVASLVALENELVLRSHELDAAISKGELLEAQLQDKMSTISSLESEVARERDNVKLLSSQNLELTANLKDVLAEKLATEEELNDKRKVNESLEMELIAMGTALRQSNDSLETLKSNFDAVICERDDLCENILIWKKELEMAQAIAQENEAIAAEARQIAETRKLYAEDKEEEIKLLERSVEELECTVNVLENKVDIVKGDAERQRLQREELEFELHTVKQQMLNLRSSDTETKRHLDEKDKSIQEAYQRLQILEREIASRDEEITKLKAHISELNLLAEAQAHEYKQKFKALEAMVEQVKHEGLAIHTTSSSACKSEKSGPKSRGSGSPFKCIGLGVAQQIKSERDEELTAGRQRIEELEALAASRQKEIFMLNARLAATESMTHDVIRDLLGVKSDMTSYASMLDNGQVQKTTEKAQLENAEAQIKDQEIIKLKQQINNFVKERIGLFEEMDRKQAEMVATEVALEKLRDQYQLLTAENETFKIENAYHKKKLVELEAEVKKLSGQQNLQQRIHHHAKIKEENNLLKNHNEDLNRKLRRTEAILSRVNQELAHFRMANGRSPYINVDEEQRLNGILKETEEEKLQLAQKLVGLCTSILKAAGITRPTSDISLSVAEEALVQLKDRLNFLERELQDVKFKNRINNEITRLSEFMPQSSPLSSEADDNHQIAIQASQTPFLSTLDR